MLFAIFICTLSGKTKSLKHKYTPVSSKLINSIQFLEPPIPSPPGYHDDP